jgi:hypothetical protein
MNVTRKLTPVQAAAARADVGMKMLREFGFERMEVTQDKAGIEWQRWVKIFPPTDLGSGGFCELILWATPDGWNVYEPVTYENSVEATRRGIERALKQ